MTTQARSKAGVITRARWFARRFANQSRIDVDVALERDPTARTRLEVVLRHPGVHAIWGHRVTHALWTNGVPRAARAVAEAARFSTGIEIHPTASLGKGLLIEGAGVIIGQSAAVGSNVTIGPAARILPYIEIGAWSRIGAGVVVDHSVGWGSVVDAAPGHVTVD